jgi:putative ABC transport system permease protein
MLAIVIASMGLFALTLLSTNQRIKEIGIRKVVGASVTGIVYLLSKNYLKLVVVANLFAWPIAWYAMHKWLQNFAYRIDMSWWIFALAGGIALVIALLTVSWQAIRAATANPVESLRYE